MMCLRLVCSAARNSNRQTPVVPDVAVLGGQGWAVLLALPALRRGQTFGYLHLPVLPLLVVVVDGGGGGALDGGVQLPVRGL